MFRKIAWLFIVPIMVLALVPMPTPSPVVAVENPDYWPTTGWRTSTPEAQGMDSAELAALVNFLADPSMYTDSMIVIRHGYIVAEAYYAPVTMEDQHHLYSASKSITSALIGIALDKGYISGLDAKMLELYADRTAENMDDLKSSMTLADVLKMSSGLQCDMFVDPNNGGVFATEDWVQAALNLPMQYAPDAEFHYCNPNATLLSGLINQTAGMSALDFANEYLFGPLGIENAAWTADSKGVNHGASELQLTPRDMAKFGFLYLHGGVWDGQQIVPADFVYDSTHTQTANAFPGFDYGYQWWVLPSLNMYYAIGLAGQYIWVLPDKDLVFVQTGGVTDVTRIAHQVAPLIGRFAQMTTSDTALPEDTTKQAELAAAVEAVSEPMPQSVMTILPDALTPIRGQLYNLLSPKLLEGLPLIRLAEGQDQTWYDVSALAFNFDAATVEGVLTLTFVDGTTTEIPIGLDGRYIRSENRLGVIAAQGAWLNDQTFRLYLKWVRDKIEYRMDFTFAQELLEIVKFQIDTGVATATLGMMAPPAQ
ncbi:MAG: beta-lactamase family protein [Anaerolineae bacterium]|nr:beta-lactamase family protein [Anaerolineae bacterium]